MENLFRKSRLGKKTAACLSATFLVVFCQGLWAAEKADATDTHDPVLVKNEWTEVRKSDYEVSLSRFPESVRGRVSNDQKAIIQILSRLLRDKTMAAQARSEKLDQVPMVKAQLAAEIDKFYAKLFMDKIDQEAGEEFKKKEAEYAERAKEIYLANSKNFRMAERVEASHILFSLKRYSEEEGLKLAQEVREKIVAGEDFGKIAEQYSEDKVSASQKGHLGWFAYEEMVPEFSKVAFSLKNAGDVSEPVLTQFGWHLILFKGRKEAGLMPFEDARKGIMEEQRQKFVDEYKSKELAKINDDPKAILNEEVIDALYIAPPSAEAMKKLLEEAQQKIEGKR